MYAPQFSPNKPAGNAAPPSAVSGQPTPGAHPPGAVGGGGQRGLRRPSRWGRAVQRTGALGWRGKARHKDRGREGGGGGGGGGGPAGRVGAPTMLCDRVIGSTSTVMCPDENCVLFWNVDWRSFFGGWTPETSTNGSRALNFIFQLRSDIYFMCITTSW